MLRRKKSDSGFEWNEYIRTTVLVRRQARRQRVKDAGQAAGQQMRAARSALAEGSLAAGGAAVQGARAGAGALVLATQAIWSVLTYVIRAVMRPIISLVARPNIGGPLGFAGAIALGAGIGRVRGIGFDREAAITLAIGIVLMASLLPMLARSMSWRLPRLPVRSAALAAGLLAVLGGGAWLARNGGVAGLPGMPSLPSLPSLAAFDSLPLIGPDKTLQGRAYALGGDSLRVADTVVRLSGVAAPERMQRCRRGGGSWRCGAAARSALRRLVNGHRVRCALSGSDAAGRALGSCTVGGKDVGAELVREGHAFAEGSVLPRYGSEERVAREAKAGVWRGEPERPSEYRARIWDEAKTEAPDGCPIKGNVGRSARVYVLPWSPTYRRVRIQGARGDRWFCSEEEAVAAGFRAER